MRIKPSNRTRFNPKNPKNYLFASFFLFSFSLPLNTLVSNIFLITALFLATGVILVERENLIKKPNYKLLLYSTLPLFCLHIIGLVFTDYLGDSFRFFEKTISYLLIPWALILFKEAMLLTIKDYLLKGIFYGSLLSIVYLVTITVSEFFISGNSLDSLHELFNYYRTSHRFTSPVGIHPTYLGVYILTALIFLNELDISRSIKKLGVPVFLIGIIFLNSRIIFACLIIIAIYYMVRHMSFFTKNAGFGQRIFYVLTFIIVGSIGYYLVSETYIGYRLRNVYKFEISTDKEMPINSKKVSNPRIARWVSALKLVQEKPIFGYGVADEQPNLNRQYVKDGLAIAAELNYNSHNQFLGYSIRFGLFGLLILLIYLGANLNLFHRTKEDTFLLMLVVISLILLVENFLDRNFGITYAAVFLNLFSYLSLYQRKRIDLSKVD